MASLTKSEFIKVYPQLKSEDDELVRDLLAASSSQSVASNRQIYAEGDACNGIAFVLSGEIRVYKLSESGREITLYEIGPGETLSERDGSLFPEIRSCFWNRNVSLRLFFPAGLVRSYPDKSESKSVSRKEAQDAQN